MKLTPALRFFQREKKIHKFFTFLLFEIFVLFSSKKFLYRLPK